MARARQIPKDVIDEALALIKEGVTITNAARHLGINKSTLRYWTNPKAYSAYTMKSYRKHRKARLKTMRKYNLLKRK